MPTHVICKCSSVTLTDKGVAVEVAGKVVAAWFIRICEAIHVAAICLLFLQIRLAASAEIQHIDEPDDAKGDHGEILDYWKEGQQCHGAECFR